MADLDNELENDMITEEVEMAVSDPDVEMDVADSDVEMAVADLGGEDDLLASLGEEFGSDDFSKIEEDASLSEDYTGFAKGFPDWDLHPPKM